MLGLPKAFLNAIGTSPDTAIMRLNHVLIEWLTDNHGPATLAKLGEVLNVMLLLVLSLQLNLKKSSLTPLIYEKCNS